MMKPISIVTLYYREHRKHLLEQCFGVGSMSAGKDVNHPRLSEADVTSTSPSPSGTEAGDAVNRDVVKSITHAADKQLVNLTKWAKRLPDFSSLSMNDKVLLLGSGKGTTLGIVDES